MKRVVLPILLGAGLLSGCGGLSIGPNIFGGTCSVTYTDGWITIASAKIRGGAALSQVTLSHFQLSGEAQLYGVPGPQNVQFVDGKLICNVACSFGTAGQYTFEVSAPGAKTQTLSVNVPGYTSKTGGCGVAEISGVKQTLNIELEPAGP